MQAPHRAFRLTLKLEADTRQELAMALEQIARDAERDGLVTTVAQIIGGGMDGASYQFCYSNPYMLDTQEKADWANSIKLPMSDCIWKLGDHCFISPIGPALSTDEVRPNEKVMGPVAPGAVPLYHAHAIKTIQEEK